MTVNKKIFLIFTLCFISGHAYPQEKRHEYAFDSIKVTLHDFNNSTFFDYCFSPNHIFVHGEKNVDSISKPMRTESYKRYCEHRELWWEVQNPDTIRRFVNFAITIASDPNQNWIEECNGSFYETDKTHLDVYIFRDEKLVQDRIVFEPNCRYALFIDEYVSFLKRLGWF